MMLPKAAIYNKYTTPTHLFCSTAPSRRMASGINAYLQTIPMNYKRPLTPQELMVDQNFVWNPCPLRVMLALEEKVDKGKRVPGTSCGSLTRAGRGSWAVKVA